MTPVDLYRCQRFVVAFCLHLQGKTSNVLNLYPSLRMGAASFSEKLVAMYQITTCRMRRGWNVFFLSLVVY